IFVMGDGDGHRTPEGRLFRGGSWRTEAEFPLARAVATDFYFHAGGSLAPAPPAERPASTTYRYDPANPVPTIGGNMSSLADRVELPAALELSGRIPYEWRWASIVKVGGQDQ